MKVLYAEAGKVIPVDDITKVMLIPMHIDHANFWSQVAIAFLLQHLYEMHFDAVLGPRQRDMPMFDLQLFRVAYSGRGKILGDSYDADVWHLCFDDGTITYYVMPPK